MDKMNPAFVFPGEIRGPSPAAAWTPAFAGEHKR